MGRTQAQQKAAEQSTEPEPTASETCQGAWRPPLPLRAAPQHPPASSRLFFGGPCSWSAAACPCMFCTPRLHSVQCLLADVVSLPVPRSRAGFCPSDAGWGGDVSAALLRPFPRGLSGVLQISWQHLTAKLLVRHFSAWITADAQDVPVPSNSLFITQPKKTIYFFSRTGTFSKHGSPGGCAWSCPQPAEPLLPWCRGAEPC